jgi:drug/metabolite transporter (DMT)-like permease
MAALSPHSAASSAATPILLALGGSAVLTVNDMAVKALSGAYPLHQVVLVRATVGMAVVLALLAATRGLRRMGGGIRTRRPGLHALRVLCVLSSNVLYFLGLAAMPFADGVALFFVAPLLLTALSVPLLGERVGWRRWAAVGAGLLGVVVMMRPGSGALDPAALLVLGAALAYALMHILTRRMAPTEGALSMSFWTQVGFLLVACGMGLVTGDGRFAEGIADPSLRFLLRAWSWPAAADWPFFLATGLTVSAGGIMVSQAYRLGEAGLVAPFEYVAVPMGVLWGAVVFGTWPDATAWTGIALIVGAGLYVIWRETRLGRATAAAAPARGEGEAP